MRFLLKILPLTLGLLFMDGLGGIHCGASHAAKPPELVMFIAHADVPPYYLEPARPDGSGILVDMLRAVTEPLGYSFSVRRLPDKRGWSMLEHGDVNVYATAREWVDKPERFLWTDAFMTNEDVLLFAASSTLRYTGPESLYGKTVAGIKGFVYPALEEHFGPGRITRLDTTTPEAMLELLLLGRADAMLINRTEILWMFRTRDDLDETRFRMDETPIDKVLYRFVFPGDKRWEPVIDQFNRRLREMKRDGSINTVLKRYR